MNMKTVIIIPARYNSSRFPGKPLIGLLGKPMIVRVAEIGSKVVGNENIYVATDDDRIACAVKQSGFNIIMTSEYAETGTDRVAEAASKVKSDIYVNIQGDEPLVNPNDVLRVIEYKKNNYNDIINGYCEVGNNEDYNSVNIPKVVFTSDKKLIYMSRLPIPGFKCDKNRPSVYYKQVCIYAFNYEQLMKYRKFGRNGEIERYEDIEVLRFLDIGEKVRMIKMSANSIAIDVPGDVHLVEKILRDKETAQ